MDIYLPVAEVSFNIFLLLAMGGAVGFVSGMFGVGGGFLMTPLLIFTGIPPAVAVGTEANQIVASSVSGAIAYWRRRAVDIKMGVVLLSGGICGSMLGVWIFSQLRKSDQIDAFISISYVLFLGLIGSVMMWESVRAIRKPQGGSRRSEKASNHNWIHGLPLKMRFHRSRLYISAIPPFILGFLVGLLGAIMGVGGGFFLVPAMIYVLRMPTNVVVGTSLFQIIFVMSFTTVMHATANKTVDVVLALFLIVGAVIGAQFGASAGQRIRGERLRLLLAAMVLWVAAWLFLGLVMPPDNPYSVLVDRGH